MEEFLKQAAHWLPIAGAELGIIIGSILKARGERAGIWIIGASLVWGAAFLITLGGEHLVEALKEGGKHNGLAFMAKMATEIMSHGLLAVGVIVLFFSVVVGRVPRNAKVVAPEEYARTASKRIIAFYKAQKRY